MCKWLRRFLDRRKKDVRFPTGFNRVEYDEPTFIRDGYKTVRTIEKDGSMTIRVVKGE